MNTEDRVLTGRYRLLEHIGRGGMGSVWRAQDELLGRMVAVKEILVPPELPEAERSIACERAEREARVAALLEHPSIITVHDVLIEDDRPWIVMELVPGPSLDRIIRERGPLPYASVARIGADVLAALRSAHEKGVLHRDVKPGNVLLAEDGRVILTDFGIAVLEGAPSLTRTGAFLGSPGYMAPERLQERPVGPMSDLWSLAVTLYTAVEGRAPFERATPMATLGAVLTEEAPPPARAGQLGPLLWHLLRRAPEDRLPVAAAEDALRRIAAGGTSGLLVPEQSAPAFSIPSVLSAPGSAPGSPPAPAPAALPAHASDLSRPPAVRAGGVRPGLVLAGLAGLAVTVVLVVAITVGPALWPGDSSPEPTRAPGRSGTTGSAGTPGSSGTPGPAAGQGGSAGAGAGQRSPGGTALDYCRLIGTRAAQALVPGAKPQLDKDDDPPSCAWVSERSRGLVLGRGGFETTASPVAAHSSFLSVRNAEEGSAARRVVWGWDEIGVRHATGQQVAVRTVRGVGDEAFAYEVRGTSTTVDKSYVIFRSGSHVVQLEYVFERGTADPADTVQAAGQVAQVLAPTG